MKKIILALFTLLVSSSTLHAAGTNVPLYSANGFTCGRMGVTVTCKGPLPGSNAQDTVTATGHNLVYITVDTIDNGQALRYTYFSDTGCLVGYSFNTDGKAIGVVARHRNNGKANFQIQNDNYDSVISYCEQNLEGSPMPITGFDAPGVKSKPEAATPTVAPAKAATPAAKPAVKPAAPAATKPKS